MLARPSKAVASTWRSIERECTVKNAWLATMSGPCTDSRDSLVRYIDTYRDPNSEVVEEEETTEKKKPWWKGGGTTGGKKFNDFVTPTEWLNVDIREGLDPMEVERRRKHSGWNELSAEKENMVSPTNSIIRLVVKPY